MKVQNIQSQNFESKKKFVTQKTKENLKFLLTRMNAETQYVSDLNTFQSTVLIGLKYKNKASFTDARIYIAPVSPEKQLISNTILEIGNKEYTIDNNTGEILKCNKGLFSTWKGVVNKIEKYVTLFRECYFDENIITKRYLNIKGFTEQGFAKIKKF